MSKPQLRIVVHGADHIPLAVRLSKAACKVQLVASDAYELSRLQDWLNGSGVEVTLAPSDADVRLGGPYPDFGFDWTSDSVPWLHLPVCLGQAVLELSGKGRARLGAELASRLNAKVITHEGAGPPMSMVYAAELSHCVEALLMTGSTPWAMDQALVDAGIMALGPCSRQDQAGIDLDLEHRRATTGPDRAPLFARAVAEGRLGRKVSVGWHRYPGGGGPVEDPLIEDMAEEEAHFARWDRHEVQPHEIVEQVVNVLRGVRSRSALPECDLDAIETALFGKPVPSI